MNIWGYVTVHVHFSRKEIKTMLDYEGRQETTNNTEARCEALSVFLSRVFFAVAPLYNRTPFRFNVALRALQT